MAEATTEARILEIGDLTFRFTCMMPVDMNELSEFPFYSPADEWDKFTDLGEEGFQVTLNARNPDGTLRGIPDVLDMLQYIWGKLYEYNAVTVDYLPDIEFAGTQ